MAMTAHGNIRDIDSFQRSLPEWDMLDGCFPRKIRPTDIDGCIETNGYCLYLEHKLPRQEIDTGQLRTMFTQVRQGNTVIVFWGRATDGQDMTHIRMLSPLVPPHKTKRVAGTLTDLRRIATEWFQRSDAGPMHPIVEAARRRELRDDQTAAILEPHPCFSCGGKPTRYWPNPDGCTYAWCAMCEPFDGSPTTDWAA